MLAGKLCKIMTKVQKKCYEHDYLSISVCIYIITSMNIYYYEINIIIMINICNACWCWMLWHRLSAIAAKCLKIERCDVRTMYFQCESEACYPETTMCNIALQCNRFIWSKRKINNMKLLRLIRRSWRLCHHEVTSLELYLSGSIGWSELGVNFFLARRGYVRLAQFRTGGKHVSKTMITLESSFSVELFHVLTEGGDLLMHHGSLSLRWMHNCINIRCYRPFIPQKSIFWEFALRFVRLNWLRGLWRCFLTRQTLECCVPLRRLL